MPLALEVLLVNKGKGKRKKKIKEDRQENTLYPSFFSRICIINHFLKGVKVSRFSPQPQGSRSFQSRVMKGAAAFKAHLKHNLLIRGLSEGSANAVLPAETPSAPPRAVVRVWRMQPGSVQAGDLWHYLHISTQKEGTNPCLSNLSGFELLCCFTVCLKTFARRGCPQEADRCQGQDSCPPLKRLGIWGAQGWLWLLQSQSCCLFLRVLVSRPRWEVWGLCRSCCYMGADLERGDFGKCCL